jgi:hypothetical protein
MKPDVVFFGETVPRNQVNRGMESLEEANAMLVVGSSLIYSGFRFVQPAARIGIPIAAVNLGGPARTIFWPSRSRTATKRRSLSSCSLWRRALSPKAQPDSNQTQSRAHQTQNGANATPHVRWRLPSAVAIDAGFLMRSISMSMRSPPQNNSPLKTMVGTPNTPSASASSMMRSCWARAGPRT